MRQIASTGVTLDDLDTPQAPVHKVSFVAAQNLFMVKHSIPAFEVVLVFITILIWIFFLLKAVRSCARVIVTSDRHLLLSTEITFLQCIGHQNLFWKTTNTWSFLTKSKHCCQHNFYGRDWYGKIENSLINLKQSFCNSWRIINIRGGDIWCLVIN